MSRVPVSGPSITQKEIDYVTDAVTNAWYGNASMYHDRFERAFAEYTGRKYAMALPSCTSALHLSLAALGIGPGDEVLVPETTWIATSAPIKYVGATPVFVDVERDTWCMSAESMRAAVTPRTKAAIVVDLYGGMPDMDAILAIGKEFGFPIIEDSAEAIGSEYKGRRAGSFGLASTFSFHGSKTLTTGEGGMLLTDDEAFFKRASMLRDHGRIPGDVFFFNAEVGYKYKMSSMQAALGLAQLERVHELIERKRQIFSWYREAFEEYPDITLNAEPHGVKNGYWMVTTLWPRAWNRPTREVFDAMRANDIDVRPFFHPLSALPAYADSPSAMGAAQKNPIAYDLAGRSLNLPSGFNVNEQVVPRVVSTLMRALGR